jgi:hypothetical protein
MPSFLCNYSRSTRGIYYLSTHFHQHEQYDDWVPQGDILKVSDESTLLKQRLAKENKEKPNAKRTVSSTPSSSNGVDKGAAASKAAASKAASANKIAAAATSTAVAPEHVDTVMETVQSTEVEPKIVIPLPLKKQLVDDWERITQVRSHCVEWWYLPRHCCCNSCIYVIWFERLVDFTSQNQIDHLPLGIDLLNVPIFQRSFVVHVICGVTHAMEIMCTLFDVSDVLC